MPNKRLFFVFWVLLLSGLNLVIGKADLPSHSTPCVTPVKKHVVVWIHGTKLTPTSVWRTFFFRIEGMHPVTDYDSKYHLHKIAETLIGSDSDLSLDHFYIFGWSGKLSFKERLAAARDLGRALDKLNQEYIKKYGCSPVFTVMTHSHGGNVALNLVKAKDVFSSDFAIDRLILLACPVQDETKDCIANELFKKVTSFYSSSDMIQVIDPQGLYKNETNASSLFSKRMFPHHEKLIQIKSMQSRRGLMHIEFLYPKFIQNIPHALSQLSELSHKNPELNHYVFDLNPERTLFKNASQRSPFSLTACTV